MNTRLQNIEGLPAKQLQENGNFSKEINSADVAELVDARDLKVLPDTENSGLSCKTSEIEPTETSSNPRLLQNKKPCKNCHDLRREREEWALAICHQAAERAGHKIVLGGVRMTPLERDLARPETQPGHTVYFLYGAGRIKIGFTAGDAQRRESHLGNQCPVPLVVLKTVPGGTITEFRLHHQFRAARLYGEWFELSADLQAFIEETNAEEIEAAEEGYLRVVGEHGAA